MPSKVYINKVEKFMPNEAVSNDEMEEILGKINDTPSKSRRLILRNNGIQKRYYALDRNGNFTHTNAEITAEAVRSEEHTSELQSRPHLVCRLLLEKKNSI